MSLHRYAARKDDNQAEIVAALRRVGASVQVLNAPGCPDLLVGYRWQTNILETKNPEKSPSQRRLTKAQKDWHANWRGRPPKVVMTPGDALRAIGAAP